MIMRLVFFFILSLSLHAAALVYPVSFGGRSQVEIMQVTILPIEQEGVEGGGQGGNGIPERQGDLKSHRATPRVTELRAQPQPSPNPEGQGLPANAPATISDSIALVLAIPNSVDTGSALSNTAGNDANSSGGDLHGTGSGVGSSGNGFGRGNGNGTGTGPSGTRVALTQARYRDTPKPIYPENARREGHEGRVVLRVLIDNQGKTKSVELNTSSGSKALDQAAIEAIKRWRFHPAYEGDIPIDSWVNVPVDFRLTDAIN
jgi:periplasmic protein TonB